MNTQATFTPSLLLETLLTYAFLLFFFLNRAAVDKKFEAINADIAVPYTNLFITYKLVPAFKSKWLLTYLSIALVKLTVQSKK